MWVQIPLFSIFRTKKTLILNLQLLQLVTQFSPKSSNWVKFFRFIRLSDSLFSKKVPANTRLKPFTHGLITPHKPLPISIYSETFIQWLKLNPPSTDNLRKIYKPQQINLILNTPYTKIYLNLKPLRSKWNSLLNLLYHIFLHEGKGVFLLNPIFTKESMFLNWESLRCSNLFFKYFFSSLFSISRSFDFKSFNVFQNSIHQNVDFVLVTDLNYHKANTFLFKKINLPLISLPSEYDSPWENPYSLPSTRRSLLDQYFFLKCCFF